MNGHNFDMRSNFEIPVGGNKIMVLKFKVVLKGYRQLSKIFGYGPRKVSKLLSYMVGCRVALGVS